MKDSVAYMRVKWRHVVRATSSSRESRAENILSKYSRHLLAALLFAVSNTVINCIYRSETPGDRCFNSVRRLIRAVNHGAKECRFEKIDWCAKFVVKSVTYRNVNKYINLSYCTNFLPESFPTWRSRNYSKYFKIISHANTLMQIPVILPSALSYNRRYDMWSMTGLMCRFSRSLTRNHARSQKFKSRRRLFISVSDYTWITFEHMVCGKILSILCNFYLIGACLFCNLLFWPRLPGSIARKAPSAGS